MIVLDTNVISELFRPHPEPRVIAWVEALTDDVAITTVTLAELLSGIRRLPDGRRRADLEAAIDGAIQRGGQGTLADAVATSTGIAKAGFAYRVCVMRPGRRGGAQVARQLRGR